MCDLQVLKYLTQEACRAGEKAIRTTLHYMLHEIERDIEVLSDHGSDRMYLSANSILTNAFRIIAWCHGRAEAADQVSLLQHLSLALASPVITSKRCFAASARPPVPGQTKRTKIGGRRRLSVLLFFSWYPSAALKVSLLHAPAECWLAAGPKHAHSLIATELESSPVTNVILRAQLAMSWQAHCTLVIGDTTIVPAKCMPKYYRIS